MYKPETEPPDVTLNNSVAEFVEAFYNPDLWFISGGGLTSIDLLVDDILRRFE